MDPLEIAQRGLDKLKGVSGLQAETLQKETPQKNSVIVQLGLIVFLLGSGAIIFCLAFKIDMNGGKTPGTLSVLTPPEFMTAVIVAGFLFFIGALLLTLNFYFQYILEKISREGQLRILQARIGIVEKATRAATEIAVNAETAKKPALPEVKP